MTVKSFGHKNEILKKINPSNFVIDECYVLPKSRGVNGEPGCCCFKSFAYILKFAPSMVELGFDRFESGWSLFTLKMYMLII